MLALALLLPLQHLKTSAGAATEELQSEFERLRREHEHARLTQAAAEQLAGSIAALEEEAAAILREHAMLLQNKGAFSHHLHRLTGALPPGARLISAYLSASRAIVRAEAESPFAAADYAQALEALAFSEVRIMEIDENENREGHITFAVICHY